MLDTITIALVFLALLSLVVAVVAIGWLSRVSKHLSALGRRVLESEEIGRIIEAADKTVSFESRMAGCENKADESQNQLVEHETKLSELTAKLESVEQMANKNEAGLAEANPSIKALADEIQSLKKFQTATEKARSLILDAFTDMRAGIPPEEGLGTTPETAKPEETSQGPEDGQEEAADQKTSGAYRYP